MTCWHDSITQFGRQDRRSRNCSIDVKVLFKDKVYLP